MIWLGRHTVITPDRRSTPTHTNAAPTADWSPRTHRRTLCGPSHGDVLHHYWGRADDRNPLFGRTVCPARSPLAAPDRLAQYFAEWDTVSYVGWELCRSPVIRDLARGSGLCGMEPMRRSDAPSMPGSLAGSAVEAEGSRRFSLAAGSFRYATSR